MNSFFFIIIFLLLIFIYLINYKPTKEYFTNNILNRYKNHKTFESPYKENQGVINTDKSIFDKSTDPNKEDKNLPFFDKYNRACIMPYKSPLFCANIVGNYVNIFPLSYCKDICPEQIKAYHNTRKDLKIFEEKIDELKETFDNKWKPKKYYCWEGKQCKEHNYNYLDPSKNKCGQNMIAQVPLFVYDNKEQCLKDNTQCKDLDKQNCLQKSNCGWCTNSFGRGICVDGTPMGPINYNLPCWPSNGKYYNNYTGGVPNQFEN